jgi:DNA-binding protein YbaB
VWQSDQFDLTRLRQLQLEAEALSAQLSAAAEAAAGEFTGQDDARVVTVTVRGDGTPSRVELEPQWRRTVSDRGLGPAVVAALESAAVARMAAWGEHAAAEPRPVVPVDPTRGGALGDPSSAQSKAALRDLFDLIGEVSAGLDQLNRAPAALPVVSMSLGQTVRVTATGGAVGSVDFDDQWLRMAAPERIAEAVREALARSVEDAAAARERLAGAVPGLDRVRRLTASPETLLREIGLLR